MATPTGGLDLAGLIQAAQLGRSLNPEVMQQQALGNQLAQQLQQLQIAKLIRDQEDWNNPGAANMRALQATLAGEVRDPLKPTVRLSPLEAGITTPIALPGAITEAQEASLMAPAGLDEAGFPVLNQSIPRAAALGEPVVPILSDFGQPTGFADDLNKLIAGAGRQKRIQNIINPTKPTIITSGPFAGMAIDPDTLQARDIVVGGTTLPEISRREQERLDAIDRDKTLSAEDRLFARQQELERIRQAGASELEKQKQTGRETLGEIARKKETAAKPLSSQERSSLFSIVGSKGLLTTALADYDKLNKWDISSPLKAIETIGGKVGPAAGNWQSLKAFAGFGDKDFKAFNSRLKGNLFKSARALQGAGVLTKDDILRMEEISPKGNETRDAFIGGIQGMKQIMLDSAIAFRDINTSRMNPDEIAALDQVITQLSDPVEGDGAQEQAAPTGRAPTQIRSITRE